MRRRLIAWGGAVGLLLACVCVAPVAAQAPPDDDSAWGDLLGDGANVGAFDETGDAGGGGGGSGRSGVQSPILCELTVAGGSLSQSGNMTLEQLEAEFAAVERAGRDVLYVDRDCSVRATGEIIQSDTIAWTPDQGYPLSPEALADMARERLVLPYPSARMAPAPGVGTTAQLRTYFWLTNWPDEPLWQEASAGTVTARVTATAVRQTWRIRDELRGETDTENCGATAGVAFDPANPEAAGSCGWTPQHSSAGQPSDHPTTGEPCFDASVTVYWNLSWDSNVTEPEDLGTVPMTSTACIVVAEVQAVVSSSP